MNTPLEQSVKAKEQSDEQTTENNQYERLLVITKIYVPNLQPTPFVIIPLSCKIKFHKMYWFDEKQYKEIRRSDVKICLKCGMVEMEFLKMDMFHMYSMETEKHFMGYGNPNLTINGIQSNDNHSTQEVKKQ